jgi:hypothetical protein
MTAKWMQSHGPTRSSSLVRKDGCVMLAVGLQKQQTGAAAGVTLQAAAHLCVDA